jgi:HlyD family secretion protein
MRVGTSAVGLAGTPFGPGPLLAAPGLCRANDIRKVIDYGSRVKRGDPLAEIDKSLYQAQVDQAKANLQLADANLLQMQAKLDQAQRDWVRAQQLGRKVGVISDLDYDTIQATYLTCKSSLGVGVAQIAQAKAALDQAEINLRYCTIRSPVDGVIVDRRVNIGQTVVSSLTAPSLFLIAKDLKRMQLWASVNEADIGQIRRGQVTRFTVDAHPDEKFIGTVAQIRYNATMTQNVVTYTVVVDTDNSNEKLLPYLTANLEFEVNERENALLVPNSALRWRPHLNQVAPDVRNDVAKLFQKPEPGKTEGKPSPESEHPNRGILWKADGEFVRPVKVRVGLNDGVVTEITGGELTEGDGVVIGLEQKHSGGDSTSNPFQPQMFGGKKQ